ncbi:MAG: C25 family cysteine peptidase [Anaerolineae bacterium]|nr:C25 family cysteine peptidase [Anaerolineae bacterium]MDW8103024.1 C25 family cysteine peptidase [Anaerolineae bacterium]
MCYDLSWSSLPEASPEKRLKLTGFLKIALLLLMLAVGCSPNALPESQIWFLEVEKEGGYWLSPDFLADLGLHPEGDSPPAFSLSLEGNNVPLLFLRTPAGWGVFFYTPHYPTRYSSRTALKLEAGKKGAQIDLDGICPSPSVELSRGALSSIHLEEDKRYLPQAELEIPWLWDALYAPETLTFTVSLTEALPGPLTVTLQIWSHTAFPSTPDHELEMRWDGNLIGRWQWDGTGVYQFQARAELKDESTEHELTLESSLPPGTEASVLWVDYVEILYRRIVRPSGEIWLAEGEALKVEGNTSGIYAIDVTDPLDARGCHIPPDGVISTVPGHRYWIGDPQQAITPIEARPAFPLNPDGLKDVEYLVIAPPEFHKTLAPLMDLRKSQGLKVGLAEPRAIYDSFGEGRADPEAIRSLISSLPSLRYLLIVGDGTAVPEGYDGSLGKLLVVSPFTRTREIGETPADVLLGMKDGEPSVAVGRLPAASPDELTYMVNKTIHWERSGGTFYLLLVYDDEPEFMRAAEEIGQGVKEAGFYVEFASGRSEVLEILNRKKRVMLGYFGHASLTGFGDEGILKAEDAQDVIEPILVTAWGCLAAHFVHPSQESMAEAWLRSRRGAVVFLGPSGATALVEQRPLALAFYQALSQEKRLGDAWLRALKAQKGSPIIWGYALLGDPALFIKE